MNVRVNSKAMKSIFNSPDNVLPRSKEMRTRKGNTLAKYAKSKVFIIEPKTSFPTAIPIL